jgi:hypothetical protein
MRNLTTLSGLELIEIMENENSTYALCERVYDELNFRYEEEYIDQLYFNYNKA